MLRSRFLHLRRRLPKRLRDLEMVLFQIMSRADVVLMAAFVVVVVGTHTEEMQMADILGINIKVAPEVLAINSSNR